MSKLENFKDDFVLLLEAGFIAVNQADEDSAVKLFKAATLLNEKSSLPKIGLGYLHLHKLELKQSCKLFKEVLEEEPDNEMAKTFLGLAMTFTTDKVSEGEKILSESASKSSDEGIQNLAETALDFVEKFIKKSNPMNQ